MSDAKNFWLRVLWSNVICYVSNVSMPMDPVQYVLQMWVRLVRRVLGWRLPPRRSMTGDRRLRRCLQRVRNEWWSPEDDFEHGDDPV